jgi:hypothetical protein
LDIFIEGVSLPRSNIEIGTTGSRSGKGDTGEGVTACRETR